MSLSKDVQEFAQQHGSWAMLPQPWQPSFCQTYMCSTINDNANGYAQELQPISSGEQTPVNPRDAVRGRLSNRRRRQRERRFLKSKLKPGQELGQEVMSPELERDQFSQQAVNVTGYGLGPGEDHDIQPFPDIFMPMENERDVYFP